MELREVNPFRILEEKGYEPGDSKTVFDKYTF